MKALIIISDSSYADGYFKFLAQCENGDFYDVAISKDEIAEHVRHYFDAEFALKPEHLKDGIFKDEAQLILESWERSNFKDSFEVYVTAQKKQWIEFIKNNPKGVRPAQKMVSFPLCCYPTISDQNKFKNQNGFDSFKVVTL